MTPLFQAPSLPRSLYVEKAGQVVLFLNAALPARIAGIGAVADAYCGSDISDGPKSGR